MDNPFKTTLLVRSTTGRLFRLHWKNRYDPVTKIFGGGGSDFKPPPPPDNPIFVEPDNPSVAAAVAEGAQPIDQAGRRSKRLLSSAITAGWDDPTLAKKGLLGVS